ncbi:hypothetical protein DVH05_007515 [Phytophthora capsici]|nr:hypothetical protein DVH05_007515 [Phytophthora capsici]
MLSDTAEGGPPRRASRDDTALDEEEKGETVVIDSEPEDVDEPEIDTYDSDRFMIALSRRQLLDDPDADDPNLCEEDADSDGLDLDSEETIATIMDEFDEADDDFYEGVEEEDWSPRDEDMGDPDFLSDAELATIKSSWTVYDEHHSSELQLDGATDLYDGRHGPTESARAFADSPLGLFYYFMPKLLWIKIAEESNRHRLAMIDTVAQEQQRR